MARMAWRMATALAVVVTLASVAADPSGACSRPGEGPLEGRNPVAFIGTVVEVDRGDERDRALIEVELVARGEVEHWQVVEARHDTDGCLDPPQMVVGHRYLAAASDGPDGAMSLWVQTRRSDEPPAAATAWTDPIPNERPSLHGSNRWMLVGGAALAVAAAVAAALALRPSPRRRPADERGK